jgi:putative peptidoglycan lipid II flippase
MDHKKSAKNSVVVMICTLASRVLGILRSRTIATVFGATHIADTINFSFNIPNNFRKLFAEGALSSAYIPRFSALIAKDNDNVILSGQLLARMQAFQVLITLPLIIITWFFKVPIIKFLSDFNDYQQIELSAKLLFYFMFFLATITFATLYSGILQSHGSFFVAAASPLLFSITVIISITFLSDTLGPFSMVVGVIGGGFLQTLINFLALKRLGYTFYFSFKFKNEEFKQVMIAYLPVTLTAISAIIAQQTAFYFASGLSEGVITAFSNAIIIWQAPYGIFYTAIATVFFPAMAYSYNKGDYNQFGTVVFKGLTYIATFLLPATIMLLFFKNETTAVLLQSGKFTLHDTLETANILFYFSIGMIFVAYYSFWQRVCFSTNNFKIALSVAFILLILDVCLTILFLKLGLKAISLSLANTIANFVALVLIWALTYEKAKFIYNLSQFYKSIALLVGANFPLIIFGLIYKNYSRSLWWQSGSNKKNFLILSAIYLVATIIIVISYSLLKIDFMPLFRTKKEARRPL